MKRQTEIPGTERPHGDKQLDEMAVQLRKSSKRRKKAQDGETADKAAIIARMKEKKIKVYECRDVVPPLVIKLATKDNVRVQVDDEDTIEEDDDSEVEVN